MGLTIWEGPPVFIGSAKLIAKMFSCIGCGEATEEDVETFFLEQVESGCARKVGETWVYCEDPEMVKTAILNQRRDG